LTCQIIDVTCDIITNTNLWAYKLTELKHENNTCSAMHVPRTLTETAGSLLLSKKNSLNILNYKSFCKLYIYSASKTLQRNEFTVLEADFFWQLYTFVLQYIWVGLTGKCIGTRNVTNIYSFSWLKIVLKGLFRT